MNPHGQHAIVENYDLRTFGIWECTKFELITSWGSMHRNTLHRHEGQLELCYLALGRRVYVDARRTCVMHGGNVWRNAPDEPHSSVGRPSGSARFYCLDLLPPKRGKVWCGLDYESAKAAWRVLITLDPATQPMAGIGLQHCFDRMFEFIRAGSHSNSDMVLKSMLNALVADFVESVVMPAKPVEGTEKIRALIERINASDPREALEVQELVKEVGVSASYFVNAFQKVVGQTPGQYILSRRLESAARRLAEGERIKTVSDAYHFDSTQHFTRAFHKYFLETPKKYYLRVQAEREDSLRASCARLCEA